MIVSAFAEEPLRLQEVLIIANPVAADEIDTEFQTGHVTVITRDQFDVSATNVADVLNKEAGVQVRSIGGLGTYSTVSMRGSTSAQVNVYLDGILINDANDGAVDLSQFLLGNIESIEIYRGNTPVQLGFSGIGGSVNIKTVNYEGKNTVGQFSQRLGSFGTQKTSIAAGKQFKNINYFASLELLQSDNDFQLTNINKTPDIKNDDFLDRRNNGALDHFNFFTNINSSINEASKAILTAQIFNKNQHLPDHINSDYNTAKLETDYANINLKYDYWFLSGLTSSFKSFYSKKKTLYDDKYGTLGVNKNLEESANEALGFTSQFSYSYGNHSINFNLETKKETYIIDDLLEGNRSQYDRINSSFGLQNEWIPQSGNMIFIVSGRTFFTKDSAELDVKSTSSKSSTLHTGMSYQFNPNWVYKMNISSDIRLPNLSEKYGDRGYSTGNPDLLNEKALNLDLGFEYKGQRFTNKNSFFYRELEDAIFMIFNARGIGEANNISKSRIIGMEIDSSYYPIDFLHISHQLTIQKSEDLTDSRQFGEGRSLPGLSSLDNFFSISITEKSLKFTLEHEHRSGGYYDRKNIRAIKTLNQVNFKASLIIPRFNSALELAIENLTGSKKEEFNGFRVEGLSAFLEFKINF